MASAAWISRGFQLAGAVNLGGVLLFSKGLTNAYLSELDPRVFSTFGLIVICLWGLAYLAVAGCYREARWVVAVFAVEKAVYFAAWVWWMIGNGSRLGEIFETSPLTGIFFAIYGPNDLLFGVFFAWVFLQGQRVSNEPT